MRWATGREFVRPGSPASRSASTRDERERPVEPGVAGQPGLDTEVEQRAPVCWVDGVHRLGVEVRRDRDRFQAHAVAPGQREAVLVVAAARAADRAAGRPRGDGQNARRNWSPVCTDVCRRGAGACTRVPGRVPIRVSSGGPSGKPSLAGQLREARAAAAARRAGGRRRRLVRQTPSALPAPATGAPSAPESRGRSGPASGNRVLQPAGEGFAFGPACQSIAFTMSSVTFLASPSSIMVWSMKKSGFSTPA